MNEQETPSIWRRILAVLEDIDGAIDPSGYERTKVASLEKRIARLEILTLPSDQPE